MTARPPRYQARTADHVFTADTLTNVCRTLIRDYHDTATEQLADRFTFLTVTTPIWQAAAIAAAPAAFAALTGSERHTLTNCDPNARQQITSWNHLIPLITCAHHYAPWADLPPPTGNVLFLHGETETDFVRTLIRVGHLELAEHDLYSAP